MVERLGYFKQLTSIAEYAWKKVQRRIIQSMLTNDAFIDARPAQTEDAVEAIEKKEMRTKPHVDGTITLPAPGTISLPER